MSVVSLADYRSARSTPPAAGGLPAVHLAGFNAVCNTYAWEPGGGGYNTNGIYFVSLLGSLQSIKAIWASLLKGEIASFAWETGGRRAEFATLANKSQRYWRSYTKALPAAAGHQLVLLPEIARFSHEGDWFLILPRTEEETAPLYFRFLDRRTDVPLHPSWADWLWMRAQLASEVQSLNAYGIAGAFRCRLNVQRLMHDISQAVKRHELVVE